MHWVDRGPEPRGLEAIRTQYTAGWLHRYQDGKGRRPNDTRWRDFRETLREVFGGLCGYCEERTKGEVDHFHPVSRFPAQVYQWSNWIFSCPTCNRAKGDKWPSSDYVDPCADSENERPEIYFTFDTTDGTIRPRTGLSPECHTRAATMITDLNLNGHHHILNRIAAVRKLSQMERISVSGHHLSQEILTKTFLRLSSRKEPWSSIVRVWMLEQGYELLD